MASVVRAPSQIDSRVKFLIALTTTDYYVPADNGRFNAVMTQQEFDANLDPGSYEGSSSTVYRDLGKSITIINASTGVHKAMYRLVQRVNGPTSEGVSGDEYDQFYIRVWSSDPSSEPVTVARVG